MMSSKSININGLVLNADEPDSPRTQQFLTQHGMHVKRENGKVSLSGNFSISKSEIDTFLASKKPDVPKP